MTSISTALADPTTRGWYVVWCFALMLLPMFALGLWYRSAIRDTVGGAKLLEAQSRAPAGALRKLREAGRLAKEIEEGRYGASARNIQHRAYWVTGGWLLVNIMTFGVLFWADEVNRTTN